MKRLLLPTWLIVALGVLAVVLLCIIQAVASADERPAPTEAERVFERAATAVVAVVIPPPPMPFEVPRGAPGARPIPEGAELRETELGPEILVDPESFKGDLPTAEDETRPRPPGRGDPRDPGDLIRGGRLPEVFHMRAPGPELSVGLLIDGEGHILTILPAQFAVDEVRVEWLDGTEETCRVTGRDSMSGLCLLKSERADLPAALEWGDDETLRVGSTVYSIAHAEGFRHSLDVGLIAGLDRNPEAPQERQDGGMIQTTLDVYSGTAGAPLLDADAKVVGIRAAGRPQPAMPTAFVRGVEPNIDERRFAVTGLPQFMMPPRPAIDLAMTASQVRELAGQLRVHGRVRRGWLGVQIGEVGADQRRAVDLPDDLSGVLIVRVFETSAADAAGLRANDVLLSIDDRPITTTREMVRAVQAHKPGDRVTMSIWRDRARIQVAVTLWDEPEQL